MKQRLMRALSLCPALPLVWLTVILFFYIFKSKELYFIYLRTQLLLYAYIVNSDQK